MTQFMDKILGVKIDNLEKKEIFERIESFLSDGHPRTISDNQDSLDDNKKKKVRGKFHQIATINPEFILEAQKNKDFKNILNNCDLNIADGMGVKLAFWRYGKSLKYRMPGIDLMLKILEIANKKQLGVFLIANKNGLSTWEEAAEAIKIKFPTLSIQGVNLDIIRHSSFVIRHLENYEVIFCNLGAPYQEIFLNLLKNDTIRLAIGVGGSFDYLTGKLKRAPKWMQFFGVEWLWRLILQPQRWKRIWNATIIFPIKIIFSKK